MVKSRKYEKIYFETLNSYIAQIYNGLITNNEENKNILIDLIKNFRTLLALMQTFTLKYSIKEQSKIEQNRTLNFPIVISKKAFHKNDGRLSKKIT